MHDEPIYYPIHPDEIELAVFEEVCRSSKVYPDAKVRPARKGKKARVSNLATVSVADKQNRLLLEVRDKMGVDPFHLQLVPKPMRFKKGYNDFARDVGWTPMDGLPDAVPAGMVVHDMLEHFVEGNAAPHWEFAAIGAAIWLRGEGGYFGTNFGAGGNSVMWDQLAASAFGMLFFHIVGKQLKTKKCPLLRAAYLAIPNATEFAIKRTTLSALIKQQSLYNKAHHKLIEDSLINGEPWIRLGYQLALARYKGLESTRLSKLYLTATGQIQYLLTYAQPQDELEVAISPATYEHSITLHSKQAPAQATVPF